MQDATNISTKILSYFNNLEPRVVQKGNIGGYYSYALQLMRDHTYVYRARNALRASFNTSRPVLNLTGSAGGHTQTWEFSGKKGHWFVGTKATTNNKYGWDKQIARVKVPDYKLHNHNYELPRLSWLTHAGGMVINDQDFNRSEAALSPDYSKMLIAVTDKQGNGYFSLYDTNVVNDALDRNGSSTDTRLDKLPYLKSFKVSNFVTIVQSLQGFDIDENDNIYVSSEYSPKAGRQSPRKIVKIPWGVTDSNYWQCVELDNYDLDRANKLTELEGIQVLGNNHVYLTVSYHFKNGGTDKNHRVYEITWN